MHALRAHDDGFDLDASVRVAAQHAERRDALERLLRYCARPPLAEGRLALRPDGRVSLALKSSLPPDAAPVAPARASPNTDLWPDHAA